MAISYAPRRGDPDTKSPGSFRNEAVRLVVKAAREFLQAGTETEGLERLERLELAVQLLDNIEGRRENR